MTRKKVAVAAGASLLVLGCGIWGVRAAESAAKPDAEISIIDVDQGPPAVPIAAVRASEAISLARRAIHERQIERATNLLTRASSLLSEAHKVVAKANADPSMLPIEESFILSDDYRPTPKNENHVAAAKAHLAAGNRKAASAELKLAEVDASFTRVLMPYRLVSQKVAEAERLLKAGKTSAADLALQAAQNSVAIDSQMVIGRPSTNLR